MKLLFVGDLMCHDEQLIKMKFGDKYNFDQSFSEIKSTFDRYDYVIGNLETVLTDGPYNGFPKFSTPKEFCGSAIMVGMNCFMLANNHICDRGVNGVKSTINYLESNDVQYTGVGIDSPAKPIIIGNVGIINYTNIMNIKNNDIIYNDLYNVQSIKKDIDDLRNTGIKTIIAVVHWGKEYQKVHSREQETIARQLINNGVDVIVGSHPHVIQDIENINGHAVFYSMGNFLCGQIEKECQESIGVEVIIENDYIKKLNLLKFNTVEENDIFKVKEMSN